MAQANNVPSAVRSRLAMFFPCKTRICQSAPPLWLIHTPSPTVPATIELPARCSTKPALRCSSLPIKRTSKRFSQVLAPSQLEKFSRLPEHWFSTPMTKWSEPSLAGIKPRTERQPVPFGKASDQPPCPPPPSEAFVHSPHAPEEKVIKFHMDCRPK